MTKISYLILAERASTFSDRIFFGKWADGGSEYREWLGIPAPGRCWGILPQQSKSIAENRRDACLPRAETAILPLLGKPCHVVISFWRIHLRPIKSTEK